MFVKSTHTYFLGQHVEFYTIELTETKPILNMAGKSKKQKVTSPTIKSPKAEMSLGTKVEAMDFLGNWYAAKIVRVKSDTSQVLIHFDGWNSRFDVWVPKDSKKLRLPKLNNKSKLKEKEWRIGDRVIAKWGPAGKLYPATISKITNESHVEVTFYDGFKKVITKSSLKADTEKLYRQYLEGSPRKTIVAQPLVRSPKETTDVSFPETLEQGRSKRRLTEPAAMADYVTDLHSKRRMKRGSDRSTSEDDKSNATGRKLSTSSLRSPKHSLTDSKVESPQPTIPKVKLKVQNDSVSVCKSEDKGVTPSRVEIKEESVISKTITPSGVEIVKRKNKSYMMFPVLTPEESQSKRGAPVELAPENQAVIEKESITNELNKLELPPDKPKAKMLSDPSLKVKFQFGSKNKQVREVKEDAKVMPTAESASSNHKDEKEKDLKSESVSVETEQHSGDKDNFTKEKQESSSLVNEMPYVSKRISAKKKSIEGVIKRPALSEAVPIKPVLSKKATGKPESIENITRKPILSETVTKKPVLNEKVIKKPVSGEMVIKKQAKVTKSTGCKQSVAPKKANHGKKFEEKYEMFKLKWKEEKEKRRKMLQEQNSSFQDEAASKKEKPSATPLPEKNNSVSPQVDSATSNESVLIKGNKNKECGDATEATVVSSKKEIVATPDTDISVKPTAVLPTSPSISSSTMSVSSKVTGKQYPRIKHTPHSRFGRVQKHKQRQLNVSFKKGEKQALKNGHAQFKSVVKDPLNKISEKKLPVVIASSESCPSVTKSSESCSDIAKSSEHCTDHSKNEVPSSENVDIKDPLPAVPLSVKPIKPKGRPVGWPKGKPRKKKIDSEFIPEGFIPDTSRTPNVSDTLSFASMVSEERPSQRLRPEPVKYNFDAKQIKVSKPKTINQPGLSKSTGRYLGPNKLYFNFIKPPQQNLSAAQIVAAKIQKRVHQKLLYPSYVSDSYMSTASPTSYPLPGSIQEETASDALQETKQETQTIEHDSDDAIIVVQPSEDAEENKNSKEKQNNELDLTGIELKEGNKTSLSKLKPIVKKRKSLDFITGRLQYKQKMETYKKINQQLQKNSPFDVHIHNAAPRHVVSPPYQATHPANSTRLSISPISPVVQPPPVNIQLPPGMPAHNLSTTFQQINATSCHILPNAYVSSQAHARMISPPLIHGPNENSRPTIPHFAQNVMQNVPRIQQISPNKSSYPSYFFPHGTVQSIMPHCSQPNCQCEFAIHQSNINHIPVNPNHSMVAFTQQSLSNVITPHVQGSCQPMKAEPPVYVINQLGGMQPQSTNTMQQIFSQQAVPTKTQTAPIKTDVKSALTALLISKDIKKNKISSVIQPAKDVKTNKKETPKQILNVKKEGTVEKTDENQLTKKKKRKRDLSDKEEGYQFRKKKKVKPAKDNSPDKKLKVEQDAKMLAPKEFSVESPLDEYKCSIPGCNKTFRKSHLLEYHHKYFHTVAPFTKRSRSSISISSTESNPPSALPSPNEHAGKSIKSEDLSRLTSVASEIDLPPSDVTDCSDTDSDSGDEITSVDDCVKCVCEDECELGFMIQCEQCFTWQHGECVGYSQQKSVPLFYLCHICSNPKGLRKSSFYDNDYTWYRHGRLPPTTPSKTETGEDSATKQSSHVNTEDEEVLSNIMLTTHGMVSELFNIRDVLQGIRQKFIMCKNPNHPLLMEWKADDEATTLQHMKGKDENKEEITKKITEHFDKSLSDMINSIRRKNNATDESIDRTSNVKELTANDTIERNNINVESSPKKGDDFNTNNANIGDEITDNAVDKGQNHLTKDTCKMITGKDSNITPGLSKQESSKEKDINNKTVKLDSPSDNSNLTSTQNKRVDVIDDKQSYAVDNINDDESSIPYMETDCDEWNQTEGENEKKQYKSRDQMELGTIFDDTCLAEASRESLLARYNLLVEVERIEDVIAQRLKNMQERIQELEAEYDSIDQSQAILEHFKSTFKLPDMQSLVGFLNKVKWTSIINKTAKPLKTPT
ncbi:uncharacterized protein LOC130647048 isoform X2 [Hydractinia symbiolongicarpus]|uniref:uncharacterized protein LOC130647048 isoform X2 n=1 Tax=Hydractinia symbiolongicarpus TaxID=13093 RepID=UPI00254E39B4|nr:uncharacterized protein LOC130647048 isoform X2 [Hydractinia symbiolongicarpus]